MASEAQNLSRLSPNVVVGDPDKATISPGLPPKQTPYSAQLVNNL